MAAQAPEIAPAGRARDNSATAVCGGVRVVHRVENLVLAAALLLIVVVGLADLSLWKTIGIDLSRWNPEELLRHLTLVLGVIGGVVAARDGRLLSFEGAAQLLPQGLLRHVKWIPGLVAVVVAMLLAAAGASFVAAEAAAGQRLACGIPRVAFVAVLPIGFALMAARIAWRTSADPVIRATVLALAMLIALAALQWPMSLEGWRLPALALLGMATLLGAPIFVVLGGAAVVLFWSQGDPIASIALDHYDQVTNPLLATLPLFTLAGYVLAESSASARLVRAFIAWTGHLRGGAAAATALCCAFFTAFTGGSGVTILALGGLLMPVLLAAGYRDRESLGLVTGAGSLGVLLPPCLPLILYSIVAQVSLEDMFLGGIVPSLLLVGLTVAWGAYCAPRRASTATFDLHAAMRASWEARWELLMPVIPLVLIFGGYALPVPAAAITAAYALAVELLIHRDPGFRQRFVPILVECATLVGGVLLILGTAMGFTNYLITAHVPDDVAAAIGATIEQRWLFLLLLNILLIAVGCLMDIFSAIIVIAPLIVPLAPVFDINPVHLGVIFLANLELGYLTPPLGLNLFLASYRFGRPVLEVARASLPILLVLLFGVGLITYWPAVTTWLPDLVRGP
jgi:tripartite ATP-independent transporter DctM subunit